MVAPTRIQGVINLDTVTVVDPYLRAPVAALQAGDLVAVFVAHAAELAAGVFDLPAWPSGYAEDSRRALTIQQQLRSAIDGHGVAAGGETEIAIGPYTTAGSVSGVIAVDVYRGPFPGWLATPANQIVTNLAVQAALPSVDPADGKPAVIHASICLEPNYSPTIGAPWTQRLFLNGGWNRETFRTADQLIDPSAGPYGGESTSSTGDPGTSWRTEIVAFLNVGGNPFPGEPGGGVW